MNPAPIQNFLGINIHHGHVKYDIDDLLKLVAPRTLLIVSADKDIYAQDAEEVYQDIRPAYEAIGAENALTHKQYKGEHALDQERFDFIVSWFIQKFSE